MRLIPNLNVFRPADTNEILHCYKLATDTEKPSAFALSRQKLPNVSYGAKNILKGGYVLSGTKGDVSIFASGSEVSLALDVAKELKNLGIKCEVCSFPSLNIFEAQSDTYKNSVLNGSKHKVVIEASNDTHWYKYLNEKDLFIGVENFGESGNAEDLDRHFGFTTNLIVKKIKNLIKK